VPTGALSGLTGLMRRYVSAVKDESPITTCLVESNGTQLMLGPIVRPPVISNSAAVKSRPQLNAGLLQYDCVTLVACGDGPGHTLVCTVGASNTA